MYVQIVGKIPDQHWMYGYYHIQGKRSKKDGKLSDKSVSNKHLYLVPWIWELSYIQMLIWYFSNYLDIYDYVGELPKQHFSVWLLSNPGDKILFLLKFYEARVSEWNIYNNLYGHNSFFLLTQMDSYKFMGT